MVYVLSMWHFNTPKQQIKEKKNKWHQVYKQFLIIMYLGGGLPVLFSEKTDNERQVGWYEYADGTKKPVYERAITGLSIGLVAAGREVDIPLPADINIDVCIKAVIYDPSNSAQIPLACLVHYNGHNYFYNTTSSTWSGLTTLILQYTKTTDTPI